MMCLDGETTVTLTPEIPTDDYPGKNGYTDPKDSLTPKIRERGRRHDLSVLRKSIRTRGPSNYPCSIAAQQLLLLRFELCFAQNATFTKVV